MDRQIISTEAAPAAIGPYSQAVRACRLVFTAGQIPLTPAGELVGDDVVAQTHQVMDNLRAVLEAAGTGLEQVIKTTIFCTDLADFAAINQAYGTYFPETAPARSTVQVAALPRGAKVEIEAVALMPA